jgi:hypothetical protein
MGDSIDIYSNLPHVIDVGGIKYYMLSGKPVQDLYKSRDEYLRTFGRDSETERILRQYMGFSLQPKRHLKFDSPEDKQMLVTILKHRAAQLKASEEFSSSVLKNTMFQRSYLNIQKLIQQLTDAGLKKDDIVKKTPESDKCAKAIKQIPEDKLFVMLLEIAWYLLHPNDIPKDIQCTWAELIRGLDTLHLNDIVEEIKKTAPPTNDGKPINYFSKAGLDFVKKPKFENALQMIHEYTKKMDGNDVNNEMKKRLEILLKVLIMKKYLDNASPITNNTGKILSNTLITNPMRGGAGKTIDRPLGLAMVPFFDYFKAVFDPIYSFLEGILLARVPKNDIKTATIPQLVTLLHICNNLKPKETPAIDANSYGMYRITNIGDDILGFFRDMLGATRGHIDNVLVGKTEQFNKQIFNLPKVRLTSLITSETTPVNTIPYNRFFVLDNNFTLKGGEGKEVEELKNFFKPEYLYILCTNPKNDETVNIDIPMNLYEIDFEDVNVNLDGLPKISVFDSMFSNSKQKEANGGAGTSVGTNAGARPLDYKLDNFIDITPNVDYNEAELALSIFILFKQLMPK